MGIQFTRNYRFDCEFVLKYFSNRKLLRIPNSFVAKFLKTVHTVR